MIKFIFLLWRLSSIDGMPIHTEPIAYMVSRFVEEFESPLSLNGEELPTAHIGRTEIIAAFDELTATRPHEVGSCMETW